MDGWMGGLMVGSMKGWIDGRMEGWVNGWMQRKGLNNESKFSDHSLGKLTLLLDM